MPVLLDTNVLLRTRDTNTTGHTDCVALLLKLFNRKSHPAVICAQNVIEFWVVATRPVNVNGLGLSPEETDRILDRLLRVVPCLPEPPDVARRWREVLRETPVAGKQAHDARLVAVMRAYGIADVETLNARHLSRFSGVKCHTPAEAVVSGIME